jgi:hypothetical protein
MGEAQLPEITGAVVLHVVEDNEIAHANVRITLANVASGRVEELKTAIVDRLWQVSRGPLHHRCVSDHDINPHPSNAMLDPPGGAYFDDRSLIYRAWYIVRFWLLAGLWRLNVIPLAEVYRSR